jgi:hypothetical protein
MHVVKARSAQDVTGDLEPYVTRCRYSLGGLGLAGICTFDRLDLSPGLASRLEPVADRLMLLPIQGAFEITTDSGESQMIDVGDVVVTESGEGLQLQNASGWDSKLFTIVLG